MWKWFSKRPALAPQDPPSLHQLENGEPASVASREVLAMHAVYHLPSLQLLDAPECSHESSANPEQLLDLQRAIIATLQASGIRSTPGDITYGPKVTRFELYPGQGVRLERFLRLERELKLAARAEHLEVIAPIPGKETVGIDVTRPDSKPILLTNLLTREEFVSAPDAMTFVAGLGIGGELITVDLAAAPHILLAGSPGAQNTHVLVSALIGLLYKFTPEELRLLIISPDGLELREFASLPHLVVPIVTDSSKARLALRWVADEIEKRIGLLAQTGTRDIRRFNARVRQPSPQLAVDSRIAMPDQLPFVVIIVAEFAPLIRDDEFQAALERLGRRGPSVGVHFVISTSAIRKDVFTDIVRGLTSCRIVHKVETAKDSRLILGEEGADSLLGQGDLLVRRSGTTKAIKVHSAAPSEQEVRRVVEFCEAQRNDDSRMRVSFALLHQQVELSAGDELLFEKCIEVMRQEQKASTSLFQRRLRLGYTTAARMLELLELRGFVGPGEGANPREILINLKL